MAYEIKQIGHINGDKWMNGVIPNMKVGEIRFYPQDNPNCKKRRHSDTHDVLIRTLKTFASGHLKRSLFGHFLRKNAILY